MLNVSGLDGIFTTLTTLIKAAFAANLKLELPTSSSITEPKVLVYVENGTASQLLEEIGYISQVQHLAIVVASSVQEAIDRIPDCDLALLQWRSETATQLILNVWNKEKGGPVCIISDDPCCFPLHRLYLQGVYNVFPARTDPMTIVSVLLHYRTQSQLYQTVERFQQREEVMLKSLEEMNNRLNSMRFALIMMLLVLAGLLLQEPLLLELVNKALH